jgi:hypothetical protein
MPILNNNFLIHNNMRNFLFKIEIETRFDTIIDYCDVHIVCTLIILILSVIILIFNGVINRDWVIPSIICVTQSALIFRYYGCNGMIWQQRIKFFINVTVKIELLYVLYKMFFKS